MIQINNISKRYGDVIVFENYSLALPKGHTYAIMGQSGKGKTTLLHMLMGLIQPDQGEITGVPLLQLSAVFQENRLCDTLDCYTNILLPHLHKKSALTMNRTVIQNALDAVGLPDCLHRPISTLSGGMKRRVAIVRALLAEYQVLLMDEPFKGLDEQTKAQTMAYVKESTVGKTVLFITHDDYEVDIMHPSRTIYM